MNEFEKVFNTPVPKRNYLIHCTEEFMKEFDKAIREYIEYWNIELEK